MAAKKHRQTKNIVSTTIISASTDGSEKRRSKRLTAFKLKNLQ